MFKPMLAPNDQPDLDEINYPILASYKIDGIRCIFDRGEMLSRSLKPIVNKQLREKFAPVAAFSGKHGLRIDGEIYSHELTFQEITRFVMTKDFADVRSIKKHGEILEIPEHLKFNCFDCIADDSFSMPFGKRLNMVRAIAQGFPTVEEVVHVCIDSKEALVSLFDKALEEGYEGLILRDVSAGYKCGRGTLKEGSIYKVKPYRTFDAQIIDVVQSTEVDPLAERKTNELGRSVTSKKRGDRILIDRAAAFLVEFDGKRLKVPIGMVEEERIKIWEDRNQYPGKYIEYKGMLVGAKDVPRHPIFLRFREDKD